MESPKETPRDSLSTASDPEGKQWWWHRRTRMERFLFLALYFVTLGNIIFLIALISCLTHADEVSEFCFTPECLHEARTLLDSMNFSVDPCVDFYRFVCGKYESRADFGNKTVRAAMPAIQAKVFHQMVSILEEPIKEEETRPTKLAKTLYGLCVDTKKIDQYGFEPLLKMLASLGGWPVLVGESWDEPNWLWYETLYKFRKFGIDCNFIISINLHDVKGKMFITLSSPPRRRPSNKQKMVEVAKLLGATPELAEDDMDAANALEKKFSSLMPRKVHQLHKRSTIKHLTKKFPSIKWLEYINNMISLPIPIDETERVIFLEGPYFESIARLMAALPKRLQANYLFWKAIESTVKYLPKKIRMENESASTGNEATLILRQKECFDEVDKSMSHAISAEYVARYVSKELKTKVSWMVGWIKAELDLTLRTVVWMDEKTRINAIKKNTAMRSTVAYPEEILDSEKIDMFYKGLEINNERSYFEVFLNITKFKARLKYGKLREKVIKRDWVYFPPTYHVNAYYYPQANMINVLAAILQGRYYSIKRPNYLNYGGIGMVIGHEMTHGFDSLGHRYDLNGIRADWWDPETKREFLEKTQCMVDQYSNYTLLPSNITLNGSTSLGENIADNGGFKLTYRAYRNWAAVNNKELKLPGFKKFTNNQMLWISIAANWCASPIPEKDQAKFAIKVHSPSEFRVKGPVSNNKEFAQDFKCPIGSPMNPTDKCIVW